MGPHSYQNSGDWAWFGRLMIQQLIRGSTGVPYESIELLEEWSSEVTD